MKLRTIVVASIALVVAGAACADATGGGSNAGDGADPSAIDHPTGGDQLVLRISSEGGFVAPEVTVASLPWFSLFGDGTAITQGAQIEIYPQPALPPLVSTPITEDGIQAILEAAEAAGLPRDATYTDMGSVGIADAATTVFALTVGGETHTTRAYALSELADRPPTMSPDEFEARQKLQAFQERMGDLRSWLPYGSVGEDGTYRPLGLRLFVGPYIPQPDLEEPPIDWPLAQPLSAVRGPAVQDLRCGSVTGDDAITLLDAAAHANQLTPWVSQGDRFRIVFRPLLPDETGC
jgi:hypothetical protein